jgi:hypothetical protein
LDGNGAVWIRYDASALHSLPNVRSDTEIHKQARQIRVVIRKFGIRSTYGIGCGNEGNGWRNENQDECDIFRQSRLPQEKLPKIPPNVTEIDARFLSLPAPRVNRSLPEEPNSEVDQAFTIYIRIPGRRVDGQMAIVEYRRLLSEKIIERK